MAEVTGAMSISHYNNYYFLLPILRFPITNFQFDYFLFSILNFLITNFQFGYFSFLIQSFLINLDTLIWALFAGTVGPFT